MTLLESGICVWKTGIYGRSSLACFWARYSAVFSNCWLRQLLQAMRVCKILIIFTYPSTVKEIRSVLKQSTPEYRLHVSGTCCFMSKYVDFNVQGLHRPSRSHGKDPILSNSPGMEPFRTVWRRCSPTSWKALLRLRMRWWVTSKGNHVVLVKRSAAIVFMCSFF